MEVVAHKASTHVIWGDVEGMAGSNQSKSSSDVRDSSSSSSHVPGSAGPSLHHSGSSSMPKKVRKFPGDITRYLETITFVDQSTSSQSNQSSTQGSLTSPERSPGRKSASGAASSGGHKVEASASAPDSALARQDEEAEAEERRDDFPEAAWEALGEDEMDAIMAKMLQQHEEATPASAQSWSVGSDLHNEGKCRPCHYVHTDLGCLNGNHCNFCHLPHTKKSRPRPCKTKRLQCKKFVRMLEEVRSKKPEQFAEAMQSVSARSSYLHGILKKRLTCAMSQASVIGEEAPEPSVSPGGERTKHILSL